jgi:hypothetical protein
MDDRQREEIRKRLARMGKSRHEIRRELKRASASDQKKRRVVREAVTAALEMAAQLDENNARRGHEASMLGGVHADKANRHQEHDTGEDEAAYEAGHGTASIHHERASRSYFAAAGAYARADRAVGDRHMEVGHKHATLASTHEKQHKLDEDVGFIERESNKKNGRKDGTQAGPDPEVQRELKNQGVLARAAAMRKKMSVNEETVTEMATKKDIDVIGRHHSERMTKSNPNSKYHTIMRNRASRLKSLRDHTGPNPEATKTKSGRKNMLAFASKDSKEAKKLKPVNEDSMSHDEMNKHYPAIVKHKGKDYHRTGKQGTRFKGGEHTAEYRNSDHEETGLDHRMWRTKSGKHHDE